MNGRSRVGRAAAAAVIAVAVATVPVAAHAAPKPDGHSFAMTGDQVVPGPGDPDGFSNAQISFFFSKPYQACVGTAPQNVERPYTALHLHRAPQGATGPVVATFTGGATPQSGCAALDRKILIDVRDNPEQYYVDAHNAEFPDGALRGQLR